MMTERDARRMIVSLSTLPGRIANLEPTLDCLIMVVAVITGCTNPVVDLM